MYDEDVMPPCIRKDFEIENFTLNIKFKYYEFKMV